MGLSREPSERERGRERKRERLCMWCMCICVCLCVLFHFYPVCEKNSDWMTIIGVCCLKSTWQIFSEWREKCSLQYQHHLSFSLVFLSSLEVPPLYFRAILWITTDFSANVFQTKKSVWHHKVNSTCQIQEEREALMLFFLSFLSLFSYFNSLPHVWILFVIFSWIPGPYNFQSYVKIIIFSSSLC